ncbi:hypothetical protein KGF54_004173 [Candida jiufengensis]|uniref:uncharacterized protein n=1 Tax=Candida jiufengensis TaxID=497108 RepID=UPI0022259831|nr:uncharacterized protein KGF54_004173 [Candida jiufengensis]KAI5951099.1 hypothetical protein KGF54_004173 [Candida jiufengensis]
MDSESTPPSYTSLEYENNLNTNAQYQQDQQEQNNQNSEFVPQLIKIPNSVSLIQLIDDDIIELKAITPHVECNESTMCFTKKAETHTHDFIVYTGLHFACGVLLVIYSGLVIMIGSLFWLDDYEKLQTQN